MSLSVIDASQLQPNLIFLLLCTFLSALVILLILKISYPTMIRQIRRDGQDPRAVQRFKVIFFSSTNYVSQGQILPGTNTRFV
jgi:hypothetical protein